MAVSWTLQCLWGSYLAGRMALQKIDGFSDGMEDGWTDTLGNLKATNDGAPVLVGLVLGGLDG